MDRQCFYWRHWHHWHQWNRWHRWIAICTNGSPMFPMAQSTLMTSLMPLAVAFIGNCRRHIASPRNGATLMAPLVIVIGANGDGVHHCSTIRSIAIGANANGSPLLLLLAPFLSWLAQMVLMAKIPNRYDTYSFTKISLQEVDLIHYWSLVLPKSLKSGLHGKRLQSKLN